MSELERLRAAIPDAARDIRLNLESVLRPGPLSAAQRWGVAIASAAATKHPALGSALVAEAQGQVAPGVIEDALAAATLMAMNNVYYRFRHFVGKPSYSEKPARLRMNRLVRPAADKLDFELFALAASAIGGCESCVRAHERVVIDGGLSEDQVHDAVRIAAVIAATTSALELPSRTDLPIVVNG